MDSPVEKPASSGFDVEWLTARRFALVLAVLVFALFPDVLVGLRTFVFRDFGAFGYPLAYFYRESFWRGQWPLWNPLNNFGLPFLAQWNTQVLYPPALFYLLFPLSWSLAVFCLLHLFLGGLGMYRLAHRWSGNRLGASVAGLSFAFTGLMMNSLMWPNDVAAFGWMPWVVWSVEQGRQEGGRRLLLASCVAALQMLTGAPEVVVFTWLILGAMWLVDAPASGASRLRLAGRFTAVIALVSGLAAAQLLPFLDLLQHSHRDPTFGDAQWSMPPWGWANFLVPSFRCHQSALGVLLQYQQGWTSSYYVGAGILALAFLAVLLLKERRVWALGAVALLGAILALGDSGYLFAWLRGIFAQIGFMRFPVKFVVLTMFSVPVLAGLCVARFVQRSETNTRRFDRTAAILWLVLVLLIASLIWFSRQHPLKEEVWQLNLKLGGLRALWLTLLLYMLHAVRNVQRSTLRLLASMGLLLVVWLDLITHAPRQNPVVDRAVYQPGLITLEQMQPKPAFGKSRALRSLPSLTEPVAILSDPVKSYLCSRIALVGDINLLDGIPKCDGFYSLYLREERDVHFNFYPSTNSFRTNLAVFLGVCQVSDPNRRLEWLPQTNYMPMITAGQKPVFVDETNSMSAILAPTFDPRAEVFLPLEARTTIHATNAADARILSDQFSNQNISAEVESIQPCMVVVAQAYYHPWKAFVDGVPTRLWRANHAFQAVEVPAGRHQIRIVYRDRAFHVGAGISVLSLCGIGLAWIRFRKGT